MSRNKSVLLFPDIHGRDFWKEGLKKRKRGEPVIFLGDYTDPYPDEGIWRPTIPGNMREIFDTKNAIFLIGNHDLPYIFNNFPTCREDYDPSRRKEIRRIFEENWNRIHVTWRDQEHKIIYSHAGLLQQAYLHYGGETRTPDWVCDYFEEAWKDKDANKLSGLSRVSWQRGGDYSNGSLVWADIREHVEEESLPGEYWWDGFQVFAHSRLREPGIIIERERYAMIDCQRPVRFYPATHKFEIL